MSDIFTGAEAHMWSLKNGGGGAVTKSVQRGTATLGSGVFTLNVPITAVDLTKAFVSITFGLAATNSSAQVQDYAIMAKLTSASNLELSRTGNAGQIIVDWQVIEFSAGVRVQQTADAVFGTAIFVDVPISAVVLAKSFVVSSWRSSHTGTGVGNVADCSIRSSLTSSTNLHLERRVTTQGVAVAFIVEFL